ATTAPVPGAGPAGPAGPASGQPGTGTAGAAGQGGTGEVARDLLQGDPGRSARRAITSLHREIADLSGLELVLYGLLALASLGLTVIATTSLWWMLHAWRTPASLM